MDQTAREGWLASLDSTDLLAIGLSLLLPGAGHIILGQTVKGLVILLLVFATLGVGLLVSVVVALDCYLLAKARKQRTVGDWEIFPQTSR